jgi:hypothetical protein
MPRPLNRWSDRRKRTVERADALTAKLKHDLPINLGTVAHACGVKLIQFQPLLLDAGLAFGDDGFHIYVRAPAENGADFTRRFSEDGTGRTLPPDFARSARFTIAHEIAHTLIYNTSTFPPRHLEAVNVRSIGGLEHTCNVVAAALMLPENIFETRFRDFDLFNPDALSEIANEALVTKTTLVWRFKALKRFQHPMGFISRVERKDSEWKFTASSVHYAFRELFPSLAGQNVSAIVREPTFVLNGGTEHKVTAPLAAVGGDRQFEFRVNQRIGRSCFLTAKHLAD